MFKKIVIFLFIGLFSSYLYARDDIDYFQEAKIIKEKLYKSIELYKSGDANAARALASEAYFSHFENMEGPIGRNIGRKGYFMERKFTNLRSYYGSGAKISKIEALVDGLVFDLDEVTPIIQSGFRLKAEASDLNYDKEAAAQNAIKEEEKRRAEALAMFGMDESEALQISSNKSENLVRQKDDNFDAMASFQEASSLNPKLQYLHDQISDSFDEIIKLYKDGKSTEAADLLKDVREIYYIRSDLEVAVNSIKNINMRSKLRSLGMQIRKNELKENELRNICEEYLDEIYTILPKLSDTQIKSLKLADYKEESKTKDYKKVADDIKVSTGRILNAYESALLEYKKAEEEYAKTNPKMLERYKNKIFSKIIMQIQDLYLETFEASGMESKIGAVDVNVKLNIEAKFSKAVSIINAAKSKDELGSTFNELNKLIDDILDKISDTSPLMLFITSLTIILREGLEALIIVVAIISYIIQSGNKNRLNIAYSALITGIVASFITAFAVSYIMGAKAGESRELIEGYTMLIAVALLFYVGFWLLSNSHNKKYTQALHSKAYQAIESGSAKTLWLTVFLAVFREGAETILFYQALLFDAGTSAEQMSVFGGLGVGIVILVVLYFLLKAGAVKIPIKQFFLITSYIIFYMCFVFTGKGIMELVEGKVFIPHQFIINFEPIVWLGLHPYYESLVPQMIILLSLIIGIVAMNRHYKKQRL